jgi:hypothetical protein|tara:strand:+ start:2736 stop:2969 length:234 start_codon:yes stop_codon:yes gene_type:complete
MKKTTTDYKKERGVLIDSLQEQLRDYKKEETKKTVPIKKYTSEEIKLKQKLISDLVSLNDFDSYDLKKLELIKSEAI